MKLVSIAAVFCLSVELSYGILVVKSVLDKEFCMDVSRSKTVDDDDVVNQVHMWGCHDGDNQEWDLDYGNNLVPNSDYSKCLWYVSEDAGSEVGVNPNDCNDEWEIEMTHWEDFLIRLRGEEDLCLGLPDDTDYVNEGTSVVLRKCDEDDPKVTWFVVTNHYDTEKKRSDKMNKNVIDK